MPQQQEKPMTWQRVAAVLKRAGFKQSARYQDRSGRSFDGFKIKDGRQHCGYLTVEYYGGHELYRDNRPARIRDYLAALKHAGIACRFEKRDFGHGLIIIEG